MRRRGRLQQGLQVSGERLSGRRIRDIVDGGRHNPGSVIGCIQIELKRTLLLVYCTSMQFREVNNITWTITLPRLLLCLKNLIKKISSKWAFQVAIALCACKECDKVSLFFLPFCYDITATRKVRAGKKGAMQSQAPKSPTAFALARSHA